MQSHRGNIDGDVGPWSSRVVPQGLVQPHHADTKAWWLLLLLSGFQDFIVQLILRAVDLLDCLGCCISWIEQVADSLIYGKKQHRPHISRFVAIFFNFICFLLDCSKVPVSLKDLVYLGFVKKKRKEKKLLLYGGFFMWCITSSKWSYPTRTVELLLLLLTQDPGAVS